MNNNVDLKNVAYEGASMYGRFNGVVSCVTGTIFICIMYAVAYYLYIKSKKHNQSIISTVTSTDCTLNKNSKGNVSYYCNLVVSYTVNNVKYSNKIVTDGKMKYNVNDTLKIKYNESDPNDIIEDTILTTSNLPYMIACCALCMCIILYIYTYLLFYSKSFAAASGAISAVGSLTPGSSYGSSNIDISF